MKYYLSSFKIGNSAAELKKMISKANNRVGCIPNARDFTGADPERKKMHMDNEMNELNAIGFKAELLDLQGYFGRQDELKSKMEELGAIWVSGGNVFVLRQAMKLSGLDNILKTRSVEDNFLYAGYSAGPCVLSPTLNAYEIVDNSSDTPYQELKETIWEGIGLIDYAFLPHYDSDHPESKDIDKAIKYCIDNKILFKALRDGEVIIADKTTGG
jgi:dipeptidase E